MAIQTLSTEDVLKIHEILVRDFAQSEDPIFPPGVKDLNLLESAVSRQHVGFAGQEKYRTPLASAATLTYGICNNHAFHNGNKRTALVSMLAHLDRNDLVLAHVPQADLYKMIIALADHRVASLVRYRKARLKSSPDEDVAAVVQWLEKRAKKPQRGEKQITYRELRRALNRFGFDLTVPASGRGNHRDVIKRQTRTTGLLRKRTLTSEKRIGTIGYKDEGTFLALGDIKRVRKLCELTEAHGVDRAQFYDDDAVLDSFISRYRAILRKLARK